MTEPRTDRPRTRRDMMPALALVVATAVSLVGSQLTLVALPWFVLQITGSPTQTGLTGSFLALPQFISGILGGAVIDRLGYRRVSIAADLYGAARWSSRGGPAGDVHGCGQRAMAGRRDVRVFGRPGPAGGALSAGPAV